MLNVMSWHVIRLRDFDQATTREHRKTLHYLFRHHGGCHNTQLCGRVVTNGINDAQSCGRIVTNAINDAQSYERSSRMRNRADEQLSTIRTKTTRVKSCQLSIIQVQWQPEWRIASYRWYEYNDDLSEGLPVINDTQLLLAVPWWPEWRVVI